MQSLIAKTVLRDSVLAARTGLYAVPAMSFAAKSGPLAGKEQGDEKQFFNKEDEKVLKNLLKKMQTQSKQAESAEENSEKSATALKKLFKDHKISEAENKDFFQALIDWKKSL